MTSYTLGEALDTVYSPLHGSSATQTIQTSTQTAPPPTSRSMYTPSTSLGTKRTSTAMTCDRPSFRAHFKNLIDLDPNIPLPDRYAMHIPESLQLNRIQSFPNLPTLLSNMVDVALGAVDAKAVNGLEARDIPIPRVHEFSLAQANDDMTDWSTGQINSVVHIGEALLLRERMSAAIASTLTVRNTFVPETASMFELRSPTGGDDPCSGWRISLNTDLPNLPSSISRSRLAHIKRLGITDVAVIDIQALSGSLHTRHGSLFPIIQRVVKRQLDWRWYSCQLANAEQACSSPRCVDSLENRHSICGRPTGPDSDFILGLIQQALPATVDDGGLVSNTDLAKVSFVLQQVRT